MKNLDENNNLQVFGFRVIRKYSAKKYWYIIKCNGKILLHCTSSHNGSNTFICNKIEFFIKK